MKMNTALLTSGGACKKATVSESQVATIQRAGFRSFKASPCSTDTPTRYVVTEAI
jgi:hypothetical protein